MNKISFSKHSEKLLDEIVYLNLELEELYNKYWATGEMAVLNEIDDLIAEIKILNRRCELQQTLERDGFMN